MVMWIASIFACLVWFALGWMMCVAYRERAGTPVSEPDTRSLHTWPTL